MSSFHPSTKKILSILVDFLQTLFSNLSALATSVQASQRYVWKLLSMCVRFFHFINCWAQLLFIFLSQINYFNMFTLFNWLHFSPLFPSLRSIFSVSIILCTSLIFRYLRFIFCRSVHLMSLVLYVGLMGWQTVFQISVTRVAGLSKLKNFPFDFTSLVSYKRMYVRMRSRSTGKIKSEELS